jgi:replicative DNA helicase
MPSLPAKGEPTVKLLAAPPDELSLPVNLDAERYVLGAMLSDEAAILQAGAVITEDDFSLEKHRTIFRRICGMNDRGEMVDYRTLTNELNKHGEMESVDGISYLTSLCDGLPKIDNLDAYTGIVKEKSTLRMVIRITTSLTKRAASGQEDAHSIVGAAESALLGLRSGRSRREPANPGRILDEYEGGYEAFIDQSKTPKGIQTGFIGFDNMTGGLRPGELIILAARPAMGKTAMALNIATHVATNTKAPKGVVVFSLEMSRESLMQRLSCSVARIDQQKYRGGFLSHDEKLTMRNVCSDMYDLPFFIDDNGGANLMDIHSRVRRLSAEYDMGLVVIDYLQLMQAAKRENRTEEISSLSRGLKLLATELRLPFLVLSQLSRAAETRAGDHRPMLSDLRNSGSIEQDGDMVAFVYREEVYRPDKEALKGTAELILAKQRNGPTGTVKLAWLSRYTRFENLANDYDSGSPFEEEYAA